MKRNILTLIFIIICGLQIVKGQKIDNAGLEGNWIGLMSFSPKDTFQVIIKGESIQIKETMLSDNAQGNAVESSSLVKYKLRSTTYLDDSKKIGYFKIYQPETKKYNLFTFLKDDGGEFVGGGMKNENEDEKAMLEEFDKELKKTKAEMDADKIEGGLEMLFGLGVTYRKKEKFESLIKLPDLVINNKNNLLKEMDKLIANAKTNIKGSAKDLGYLGIFRVIRVFENVAIASKLNPFSYYEICKKEVDKYKEDPAVKAKGLEFEQVFGLK